MSTNVETGGSFPWSPDLADGTYRNPVLCADYPDPDVIRNGEDYFMTASSFHCVPGLPILHSRDLVNWTLVNHAVQRLPHHRYRSVQPGCGVWAPSLRKQADKFWIFFAMPDEGIYCTTAKHPADRWSEPHLVAGGRGLIDPCPFWDEDGSAYLVHAYAFSRSGIKHKLRVRPMAPDGSKLLGEGHIVFEDPQHHPTVEGPKFLKRNGFYYILAPAGGVEQGWQLALRSRSIYGPYEHKIILEQGNTSVNGPHQGALIDAVDGSWWFVHFQDAKPYGRIVHLQPARWEQEWPYVGIDSDCNGIGEPVTRHHKPKVAVADSAPERFFAGVCLTEAGPQTSDEFDNPDEQLSIPWHWNATPQLHWYSLSARPGWLRLFAIPTQSTTQPSAENVDVTHRDPLDVLGELAYVPQMIMQKFPARSFVAETRVEFNPSHPQQFAGLAIIGRRCSALTISGHKDKPGTLILRHVIDTDVINAAELPLDAIVLRVNVEDGGQCTFEYETAREGRNILPKTFQAKEGVWVGAKVGLFALECSARNGALLNDQSSVYADFDYFRFSSHEMGASQGPFLR